MYGAAEIWGGVRRGAAASAALGPKWLGNARARCPGAGLPGVLVRRFSKPLPHLAKSLYMQQYPGDDICGGNAGVTYGYVLG